MIAEPSNNAFELIKHFEGCRLKSYQDYTGVWTIGYGSTHNVTSGMEITQDEADIKLRFDIKQASQGVDRFVKVQLNQNQFDALTSFTFNLGSGNLRISTLLKKVNAMDFDDAGYEFLKWIYAGGKPLEGLIRRRRAERLLFVFQGEPNILGIIMSVS